LHPPKGSGLEFPEAAGSESGPADWARDYPFQETIPAERDQEQIKESLAIRHLLTFKELHLDYRSGNPGRRHDKIIPG
jgi:hypothetical protein